MTPQKHPTKKLLLSYLLIILLGLGASIAGYARLGVLHGGDTGRYLTGAESMAQGKALSSKQKLFLGYIRLIWLVKSLGGSQTEVVILQCLHLALGRSGPVLGRTSGVQPAGGPTDGLPVSGFTGYTALEFLYPHRRTGQQHAGPSAGPGRPEQL